ncbi:MAG TPA: CGNR zinc finger domain-containing protein [Pseudonocardiaceae bacterium]|nr:CGNR zinc finger domain-containing protein [Pseudonocardiaceae bacterium]
MSPAAHVLPDWLEPLLAFVNTVDVESNVDELAEGPLALRDWLAGRKLLGADPDEVTVSRADHRLAIDLRTGLRALALCNNGGDADESALVMMHQAFDRFPLVAAVPVPGTDLPALRPHRLPPVRAALGVIVAGYAQAVGTGDWDRIRRCPAEDCAWAFWDSSAKGARRWCNMRVCGNRAKVRAFAARKASSIS